MIKPILFNTDMVEAILEGRKTVTHRLIKPQPKKGNDVVLYDSFDAVDVGINGGLYRPPYQPDDVLYVRETWAYLSDWIDIDPDVGVFDGFIYKADWDNNAKKTERPAWKPSIHMPKKAARIFLRVTNVSVAKLQDITEEQAKAEGTKAHHCLDALNAFRVIWDSTLKSEKELNKYGWFANPWVWVIEFERTEKPNEWI